MNLIKTFPTLFSSSSNGTKEWTISVFEDNDDGIISSHYGLMTGKKQTSNVEIRFGKNIGKRNETTPIEQALKEAQSKWNKKAKNAFETLDELDTVGSKYTSPMLALSYKKRGHDIAFPCFVQPKLDGVRCVTKEIDNLIFTDIDYRSRTGSKFESLSILDDNLYKVFRQFDGILDGELFTFDIDFEEIVSAVRRNKKLNDLSNKLQYWIYDIVDTKLNFIERTKTLRHIFVNHGQMDLLKGAYHIGNIYCCPTYLALDKKEILEYHEKFVEAGYEGTIIRNMEGAYKSGPGRSKNLQKLKDFIDDEFEIMRVVDGVGKDEETAIFYCKAKNERQFRVKPEGTWKQRNEWYEDRDNLIGKFLTVKYQALSRYGIPKFGTGITIRDYE